ncbi:hypothetical protein [Flavipsychrobacter stenotrophus]|uniref:hypothetical protein n=1 Tax=Flavipsychrobacter stenotrophus TaxID=2077091 RepID=UPI00137525AA|nr:hypothetical protein [Flavipsychrobacter stenotrophus]
MVNDICFIATINALIQQGFELSNDNVLNKYNEIKEAYNTLLKKKSGGRPNTKKVQKGI